MAAVTFRGLDARTTLVRWGLVAIAVGLVAGATLPGVFDGLGAAWTGNRQALVWLVERVLAFLAYFALAGSVIYGLLLSTKVLDAIAHRPVSFTLHQDLSAIGIGLAAVHGMMLAMDKNVPFTIAQVLVPGLAPYQPLAVAAGQVALYLAGIVLASFYVRRHIGQRAWRMLHYVTFLAFAGATIHGIAAGSDTGTPWAQAIYLAAATITVFLLTYRIAMSIAARAGRRSLA
jgi:predicted ferric reductase